MGYLRKNLCEFNLPLFCSWLAESIGLTGGWMQGKRKTSTAAIWQHHSRYFGWARDDESQIYWQFGRDQTHLPLQETSRTFSLSTPKYQPGHELLLSFLRLMICICGISMFWLIQK